MPDGLVIPSDATDADVRQLASDPWLASLPADALFAVRSSGIGEDSEGHAFAGIHETQLNVRRDQIVEAVLGCRRSATSERAIAYRKARGLEDEDDDDRIGVLVQRMVPAVTSGVAFTVNPITGADQIVINAAPGLGEALLSGRVTPDEFRLRKSDLGVLSSRRVSDTSDTSEVSEASDPSEASEASDLATLGRLLVRIEQLYGAPQDVEWDQGHFFNSAVQFRTTVMVVAQLMGHVNATGESKGVVYKLGCRKARDAVAAYRAHPDLPSDLNRHRRKVERVVVGIANELLHLQGVRFDLDHV